MSDSLDLLAVSDAHDGFFPRGGHTRLAVVAHAAILAAAVHGIDRDRIDLEERLDGLLDLDLVRVGMHLEGVGAELVLQVHRLLADAWTTDDLVGVHALSFLPLFFALPLFFSFFSSALSADLSSFTRASSADLVKTTLLCWSTTP